MYLKMMLVIIYASLCTQVRVNVMMYLCMYACMHVCMYVFMYVCMYVCIYNYSIDPDQYGNHSASGWSLGPETILGLHSTTFCLLESSYRKVLGS